MRALVSLLIFCLIGVLFCSCSSPRSSEPLKPEAITLEFWTLQLNSFADYIEPLIAEYETTHPNVHIKWVDIPFQEAEKRALTVMLSDTVPDVVNLNPNFSALLAQRGTLRDLANDIPPATKKAYLPIAWQTVQLGEHLFGVPWYLTSHVLVANNPLLESVGIKAPPKQLETFFAVANTFHRQEPNAYLFMPSVTQGGNFLRELQLEGLAFPEIGEPFNLASSALALKRLGEWSKAYQAGNFPAETLTEGHQAALERYQSGSVALLKAGVSLLQQLETNAPDIYKKSEVFPQFPQDRPGLDIASMILVIPEKSRHPKQALDFALYVTNATNQASFARRVPVLPSHRGSYEHLDLLKAPSQNASLFERANYLSAKQLTSAKETVKLHPCQAQLNAFIDVAVQESFLQKKTPEEALRWFDKQANTHCL